MNTKIVGKRGRPRTFDRAEALAKAQVLFHARGYDALSVADLTEAMGINPPSFYAAFGSKLELYDETLGRYVENDGLDLTSIFVPGTPLAVGIAKTLRYAAEAYTSGEASGCMVIEGARGTADPQASSRARARLDESRAYIHERISELDAGNADLATDYAMTAMAGLSASARNGMP
jgi:TetR/AcrR family transcriptional regulator, repressor for divergent bdcA